MVAGRHASRVCEGNLGWRVLERRDESCNRGGRRDTVAQTTSSGMGASGQFSRPQWSPDGQTIVYAKIIAAPPATVDYDIYRAAADGSDNTLGGAPVIAGSTNDYQPSLSADGTKLCFRREGANKDVYREGAGSARRP